MSGPAQPHLLPVLFEVIKARAHKYLRRYRGKDGKYKYVYPKKTGKAASRHEGAMSDRSGFLGDPSIYTKGASFAGAPGEGHYVIESTDGSNVTFYLDEDKSGKRGSSKTMSRSKFRAMLTQKHRKRFEQASEEGYQRRKELVFRSQEGTPERSRAVKELARWVSLNEVYLSEDTHVEFQDIRDDFDPERVKASREEQRREEEEARAKEEREEAEREQAKRKPHLEALGLPADATNREIKKQYRKLSLQHHPDRNPGDPTAVEKMKRINNAFDALGGQVMKALDWAIHEVIKARAHKYLRRYRGKDGKYKYVYPKKAGDPRGGSRHEGGSTDHKSYLGDKKIYQPGTSFAAGAGKGHYVIESVKGNSITFHLDEDETGAKGEARTMSYKDFRNMLRSEHRESFKRAAREGLQRRKDVLAKTMEGTPARKRAENEVRRWESANSDYLPRGAARKRAFGALGKFVKDGGERAEAMRTLLGVESFTQASTEDVQALAVKLESASPADFQRMMHGGSGKEDKPSTGKPSFIRKIEKRSAYIREQYDLSAKMESGFVSVDDYIAFLDVNGEPADSYQRELAEEHRGLPSAMHKRRAKGILGFAEASDALRGTSAPSIVDVDTTAQSNLSGGKLNKRLKKFISTDKTRDYMHRAETIDGVTYATDGNRLIGIRTGLDNGTINYADWPQTRDFPDVSQIIPKEDPSKQVTFRVSDLVAVASAGKDAGRAKGYTSGWGVGLYVDSGEAKVYTSFSAETSDVYSSHRARGTLHNKDADIGPNGGQLIGVSASYLEDALSGLKKTDTVRLQLPQNKFSPIRIDRGDGEFHVIMPIRLFASGKNQGAPKVNSVPNSLRVEMLKRQEHQAELDAQAKAKKAKEVKKALGSEVVKAVSDIDLTPTEQMAANARRGLEMRKNASDSNKGGLTTEEAGKQGIGSGVARAASIANRDKLSPETVRRMKAFFDRHSAYKHKHESEPEGKAKQSWLLWGGDAGYTWAKSKVEQMNRAEVKKGLISRVKGAVSRLFGKKKGQGRWVTTKKEPRRKLFIDGDGNPTKGNPVVLAAAQGKNPRKEAERLKAESSSMGGSAGKSKVEGKAEGSSKTQSSTDNSKGKGESVQQTPTSRSEGLHRILRENPVAKRFIDAKTAEESHSIKMDYETAKLLDSYSSDATEIRKELLKQPHGWIALYKAERVFQTSGKDKQANDIQSLKFVQEHVESIQEAWDKTGCMLFDRLGEDFNPDAFRGLMEGIDVYNQVIDVRESVGPFGIKLAVGSHKERALHGGYLLNDRAILVAQARGDLGKRGEDTLIHEIAHAMDHAKEMIKASDEGADTKKIGYFSQKNADRVKAVTDGFFKSDAGTLPFTREKVDKQAMQSPTSSSEHTYENYLDLPEERFARIAQQYIDDKSVTVRGIGPTLMQWLVGTSLSEKTGFWSKRHMRKHEKEIQSLLSEVGFKFREEVKKGLVEVKKALVEVIKAKLSDGKGRWVTTKNDRKIFINSDGVPTKGNPHIIARMKGEDQSHRSATLDATQRGMEAATKKLDGLGKLPKSYGEAAQKIDALEKIVKRAQDAHSHAKKTGLMTPSGSDTAKHKETRKKIESGLSAIKSKIEEYRKASPHSDHIVRLMKLSRSMDVASEVKKALLDLVLAQLRGTV